MGVLVILCHRFSDIRIAPMTYIVNNNHLTLLVSGFHTLGQFCPGERVSSFSCTTEIVHVWSGSALAGQCPTASPSDRIGLTTVFNSEGDNVTCGIFTASITNIAIVMGDILLSSTISFTASSDLNGTEVVCRDGNQAEVENYPIMIVGKWLNQGEPG